jgi:hypothetical protein
MVPPRFFMTAAACAMLVAGCADMRWTKSGADAATAARDLDDCRASALQHAPPRGPGVPSQDPQVIDRGASPVATRPPGTSNERFIVEHESVRVCMLQRGYRLQPAG